MGLPKSERISIKSTSEFKRRYVACHGRPLGVIVRIEVYINRSTAACQLAKILHVDPTTGCSDLAMDPNDPNTLYAAFWEFRRTVFTPLIRGENCALYKSVDGATWNKSTTGFRKVKWAHRNRYSSFQPQYPFYSVIESEKDEGKACILQMTGRQLGAPQQGF